MWWRLQLLVRLLLLALLAWHACNGRPVGPQANHASGARALAASAADRLPPWQARHLAAAGSSSSSGSGSGSGGSKNGNGGSSSSSKGGGGSSSGGSSSGNGSSGSSKGGSSKTRCTPTMYSVAKRRPELRQALQLAAAGYNFFSVDGATAAKPATVFAPSNSALQALAADVRKQRAGDGANATVSAESVNKNISALKAGFYSIVLYSQLPGGAYNMSYLQKDDAANGLQTSLGKALSDDYKVSFDRDGRQMTANGGWPANNAPILSMHEACDGLVYVVTNTLRPKQQYTSLPKLQGKASVSTDDFMRMLAGSFTTAPNDTAADAPAPAPAPDAEGPPPTNHNTTQTDIVVSNTDGNGTVTQEQVRIPSSTSGSGGSSDSSTLVVAASCAGAAVALCLAAVAVVTLRKRRLRRQRAAAGRPGQAPDEDEEDDDELDGDSSIRLSKAAGRPVQLRVDA